ncbi:MAG: hypothetical protein A3G70_09050 [Planctomycetes bacterium RIFCSPLOWO2_12_FULL_39_13]|nr:MAG: hypothetical protein A3G70_09050 [Planctomycetes bacterium RIFCSPLOWO2_12_FULL_39_13]
MPIKLFISVRSNNIITEFKTAAEILFEVSMGQVEFSIELTNDNSFYYMVQEYTAPTDEEVKSVLRSFLPKSMSRKMVLNEMLERVDSDVGRNCGRVRYDLTSRIRKTIDYYSKQLKGFGNDLTAQIERAIQKGQERRKAGGESVMKELGLLAERNRKLEEQKESLAIVWNAINLTDAKSNQVKMAMM